ncbi:cyclodeaminase/cyclohydrolase family protein [Anaerolineales bacterium HSG6]|nr:cyclodeaminase/cyclohydrolase family protein [Anaerolineales bacterium HSG6]MDM8530503.1 cyclodeaminase/cyclohydrolase family protein [Anaerolineales bacterium HSG25]
MSQQQPIQQFLDDLASSAATPGGGGAAALSGAMGAALVSMVCNLTIGRKKYAEVEPQMKELLEQAEELRTQLTALIADDVAAFNSVMDAYRLPKATDEEKSARSAAIQTASKQATIVPLQAAQACAKVIELARPAAEKGNSNVVSDVGAAVAAAQSGLKASALNVMINLGTIKDETFVTEHRDKLDQIIEASEPLAQEVYEFVKSKF